MESSLVKNVTLKYRLDAPAILESVENSAFIFPPEEIEPTDKLSPRLISLNLNEISEMEKMDKSFLLLDALERLKVSNADDFIRKVKIPDNVIKVKVVSIFGNTGDGKSHTLNYTFFNGEEIFRTSPEQSSCTLGVWAAYEPESQVILLDTEGLLGSTTNEDQRTRLLLKVLAVSDLVIFRTRSERLHRDMFTFLGSASRAFVHHFQAALIALGERGDFLGGISALGPAVIIFHETQNTLTLQTLDSESPEDILRKRFSAMRLDIEAFSSLRYIGIQTVNPPTDFSQLKTIVQLELANTSVRSARHPSVVYHTLKALNDKFSGKITHTMPLLFPDQYFTCPVKCESCDKGCQMSMGHLREGLNHFNDSRCRYQHQYENCVYICKACYSNGREVIVTSHVQNSNENSWFGLARYAWSGYVIECPNCGEIYRSRQYWYGNKNPEDFAVRTEIIHIWPGNNNMMPSQNNAQKVLDGVSFLTETVINVSAHPTKVLSSWVTDKVAPSYWRPNHEIKNCACCKKPFGKSDKKHHCRACGEGFCADCSTHTQSVPSRGWFEDVRVCDLCYKCPSPASTETSEITDDSEIRARKFSEQLVNTIASVASVLDYPKSLIKDSARPSYWVPDTEAKSCACCDTQFTPMLLLHHCRACGKAVCDCCSTTRKPVPLRGWHSPTRVCDKCIIND